MKFSKDIIEKIKGKNILISLSGGADSSVLFHVLNNIKDEYNIYIEAFHFNHKTRSGQSDQDENFVRKLCEEKGVKLHVFSNSIFEYSKINKVSEEQAGRLLRKDAIEQILSNNDCEYLIATGHNKDDNVETILMRIIRGTGFEGLSGIKEIDNNLVRPLLNYTKAEILDFAKSENIPFVQDFTNFENDYTRNSIRNELIPFIKNRYNQNFDESILRLSNLAKESVNNTKDIIADLIASIDVEFESNKTVFQKKDLINFSKYKIIEIIKTQIERLSCGTYDFTSKNYEEILKIVYSSNSANVIMKDMIFYNSFENFIVRKFIESNKEKIISKEEEIYFNGYKIKVLSDKNFLLRTKKDGDKVFFNGKIRKLKDIFIEKKIDKIDRTLIPIVEENGVILAVGDLINCDEINIRRINE